MIEHNEEMVNQIILDYLRNYKSQFPIDTLRQKILSAGYSQQEVDEAISVINSGQSQAPVQKISSSPNYLQVKKGFKWMKLAGIIGITFFCLTIISLAIAIYQNPINLATGTGQTESNFYLILSIITSIIFIVMTIFFLYGFVKMGKYTDSKLLAFSALTLMIIIILLIISMIVILLISIYSSSSILTGSAVSNLSAPLDLNNVPTSNLSITNNLSMNGKIILIIEGLLILFFIVLAILFSIGLIKAGSRVRFAKAAGILSLIQIIIIAISVITFIIIILFYPAVVLTALLTLIFTGKYNSFLIIFMVDSAVIYIISLTCFILESLALFDASKKFESDNLPY